MEKQSKSHSFQDLLAVLLLVVGVLAACASHTPRTAPGPTHTPGISSDPTPLPTSASQRVYMLYSVGESRNVLALRSNDGSILWHDQISGESLVADDTAVYIESTYTDDTNAFLDALRASDGSRLWHFHFPYDNPDPVLGSYSSAPVLAHGIIYVKTQKMLYALRASDGSLVNQYQVDGLIATFAVDEGFIYLGYGRLGQKDKGIPPSGPFVEAVQAKDSRVLWQSDFGVPLAVGNRVVFVYQNASRTMTALRASDGADLWHNHYPMSQELPPVATGDVIYVSNADDPDVGNNDSLAALRANDGTTLWQIPGNFSAPIVVNGVLYATKYTPGENNALYALRASDGTVLWQQKKSDGISLEAATDRMVYIIDSPPSGSGALCALQSSDGSQRWCLQTNGAGIQQVISAS